MEKHLQETSRPHDAVDAARVREAVEIVGWERRGLLQGLVRRRTPATTRQRAT